jgi:hypothetical protein
MLNRRKLQKSHNIRQDNGWQYEHHPVFDDLNRSSPDILLPGILISHDINYINHLSTSEIKLTCSIRYEFLVWYR